MTAIRDGLFVTGTDTGVGKTWISLGLIASLQARDLRVAALKPVASGCTSEAEGLRNQDALELSRLADVLLPYGLVNPYAFTPAVAPHIAAQEAGVTIDGNHIAECFALARAAAERVVVEGVGGWRVPVSPSVTMADVARRLGLPVVLVVGMRLGCLNHALLTAEAIVADGCDLLGWVANSMAVGSERIEANIDALCERIEAPMLGRVPYLKSPDPELIAAAITLPL